MIRVSILLLFSSRSAAQPIGSAHVRLRDERRRQPSETNSLAKNEKPAEQSISNVGSSGCSNKDGIRQPALALTQSGAVGNVAACAWTRIRLLEEGMIQITAAAAAAPARRQPCRNESNRPELVVAHGNDDDSDDDRLAVSAAENPVAASSMRQSLSCFSTLQRGSAAQFLEETFSNNYKTSDDARVSTDAVFGNLSSAVRGHVSRTVSRM